MTAFPPAGLLVLGLVVALAAASASALAEGRRETPVKSDSKEDSDDSGGVNKLFEKLDFGFGGDSGSKEEGTYLERFEAPELEVYEDLKAQRSVILAIQRSSGFGLVAAPELNAYVNGVLQRIVAASPVPRLEARAFVRAETRFAAHSTPDGSIFINIGLLHDIESEDELAAVLAHELAHVLYRHHGTDWFANSQKIAAQILSLKDYAQSMVEGAETSKDSKTVLFAAFASEMSERVVAPNLWNREQEREADGLGLDLLITAGYQSGAAGTALERLATYEAESRERAEKQLDEIAKAAEADMNEAVKGGDLSQIVVGLVKGAGTALGVASNAAIDAIGGGNHDPAKVRAERLDDYINREYLFAPRPKSTALPWQSPGDPTAAVLANYKAARKADSILAEGKLDEAESLIRTAVGTPTKEDAYPRLIFYQLRAEQGDFAKAYHNLEIAADGPEPAFAIYRLMIENQLAGGRRDEAVRLVDKASRRLDEPPNLFPYRIAVLVDAQKKAEALALFAKCKLSYPDLAPHCNRALGGLQRIAAGDGGTDTSATNELIDREVSGTAKKVTTGFGN
ncbi:MAG TPA: M48 family metalloprotease [Kiloniellales bacterium]